MTGATDAESILLTGLALNAGLGLLILLDGLGRLVAWWRGR